MASSTTRKDSSSSSSSSMPMSPGLRAPHNDSSLHPPRPKSPMTFGLRRLRQPSLSSSSAIESAGPSSPSTQAHPSSPRTPASTQSSPTTTRATGKTGGLFRRPSFSQLTSSKLSNGSGNRGATSSSSPSPASPSSTSASPSSKIPRSTPRPSSRGQHTRTPSSSNTSSILSNASTAQQELNGAAHPHNRAPDPSRRSFSLDPVPASAKRKVYGREDVERYRAAGHEPHRSISQGASAITTTTQDPSAAAADTNPRRYDPPPPTSSSSSQQSAAAASSQHMPSSSTSSSSLGRNGTLKASSRFNAAPPAASPSASQSTSVRSSMDNDAVESLDSQRGGSSRPTSRPPSIYERSQSVLGVRSGSGHEASHARSQSSLRSFGMNRSDSNGSRRSIFGWGGGGSSGSSNANQPNNKKLAPTSHAHSHSRTPSTSSALKATTLEFLRSASALGHRNDRNRRADSDDSDSDDDDDERTMGSKTPEPGFFGSRGAGGHGREPSGTSGIPLFRRNRATSQSTAAALGSGQGQQQQDLPPRAPSRSSTMASSVLGGGGVGGGGGGVLSALSKVKSREGVRATEPQGPSTRQTPPRAAAPDDDDKDLPPRPSTSIGHYLSTPTRNRRPSQASISPEASFTARRKRIPSIYSLAPGVMGGSGGGQSESDLDAAAAAAPGTPTSPASATASNGANGGTGWRFGRGWMRGRKDAKTPAGVASVDPFNSSNSAAAGSGSNQALPLLSPNANSATRKWVALPEPTGSTASLHGTAPSLIFGVPLRDAVIRTRFISPVPLGEESSAAAAASEQAKKEPLSPLRARRRPSKIGLLDLGTEFSISPDLFGATGGSASASSIDSAFNLPSPASPASPSFASPTVSSPARVPVDRATARKQYLPRFVVRCIESLETYGPEEEGVYRLSGRTSHTQRIRHLFDGKMDLSTLAVPLDDGEEQASAGGGAGDGDFDCDLDLRALPPSECDLNSVCSALKAYLRELPAPILSKDRLAQLEGIVRRFQQEQQRQPGSGSGSGSGSGNGNGNGTVHLEEASQLLSDLPPAPWYLLRELCLHLGDLTHPTVVQRTKMTLNNLCLVLAPTLFIPVTTLNFLVQQREELFKGPPREDAQLDGVREGGILGGFGSGSVSAGASGSSSVAGTPSRSTTARQTPTPTTPSMIPISSARNSPRKPTAAAHTRAAGSSGSSSADAAYSSSLPHRRDPSNSRLGATDGSTATSAKQWRETVFLGLPASSGGLASDWGAALAAAGNHRDSHASVSTVTAGNQGGQEDVGGDVTACSGEGNDSTDADLTMVIKPTPCSPDEDDDAARQPSGSGSGEDLSSSMSTTNTTRSSSSAQSSLANLSSRESHSRHSSTNTAISSLLGPSVSANGIGGVGGQQQQHGSGGVPASGAAPPLPLLGAKQSDATPTNTKGSESALASGAASVEHSHDKEVLLDDDAQSTTTATTPSAATTPPVSRHNREQSNGSNREGSVRSFGSNKDVPAPPVPGKDELFLSRRRPSAASVTTTPLAATPSYLEGSTPVSRARSRTHEGSTAPPPPSAYTAPSAAAMTPSSSSSGGSASGSSSIYNRFATPMSGSSSSVNQYPYQPSTTSTGASGTGKGQGLDVPTSSSSSSSSTTTATATPASPAISTSASHSSLKSSGSSTTTSTLDRPRPIASSSSPSAGGGAGVSGRFFSWGGGRD